MIPLHTFSINIKSHLHNNVCSIIIISIIQKLRLREFKITGLLNDRGGINLTLPNTTLPPQGGEGVVGSGGEGVGVEGEGRVSCSETSCMF